MCNVCSGDIIWAIAAGLTYVSVSVFKTYDNFEHIDKDYYTLIPAGILLGAAVFMFITGVIGCIGACKESKCLLGTFFSLILLILLLEVTAAILGFVYKDQIRTGLKDGMNTAIQNYTDPNYEDAVDSMQKDLKCCGVDNYTDWMKTPWYSEHPNSVPTSCCKKDTNCTGDITKPDLLYTEGCYYKLIDTLEDNLKYIIIAGAVFAFVMIIGMVFACVLICRTKEVPYINLDSSGGYRA
ncbi:tetraspanin-36-like [Ptychodera flava]|uniref:tetraspanin-36-like n=1 Tax=Ptychodera flava TaxID=63121 RepID=UPI003969D4D5